MNQTIWSEEDSNLQNPNSSTNSNELPGPDRISMQTNTPLECFQLFFTDEVIANIAAQSNLYY